jgi:hypothetical protein
MFECCRLSFAVSAVISRRRRYGNRSKGAPPLYRAAASRSFSAVQAVISGATACKTLWRPPMRPTTRTLSPRTCAVIRRGQRRYWTMRVTETTCSLSSSSKVAEMTALRYPPVQARGNVIGLLSSLKLLVAGGPLRVQPQGHSDGVNGSYSAIAIRMQRPPHAAGQILNPLLSACHLCRTPHSKRPALIGSLSGVF